MEILRKVADELLEDEALRPLILNPFEYMGVDTLDEASVVLLVRIRTLPGKQAIVGRAFNRLVKIAFGKHGIAFRDSATAMTVAAPDGGADHGRSDSGAAPQLRRA